MYDDKKQDATYEPMDEGNEEKHETLKNKGMTIYIVMAVITILSLIVIYFIINSYKKKASEKEKSAEYIKCVGINQSKKKKDKLYITEKKFSVEQCDTAYNFAKSFPNFKPTPLVSLPSLSSYLHLKSLLVKDESHRFGLNSFKGLGASFAIGNIIAKKMGKEMSSVNFNEITNEKTKKLIGDVTFVTATDGNHGKAVAWTANMLKQKCVVYMCKGSSLEKLNAINSFGCNGSIVEYNYDDTIRYAKKQAEENGWTIVQDTTWPGYEEIPTWIMQGYSVIANEAFKQLEIEKSLKNKPTHIFLQAGVGAMAGGVTGFVASYFNKLGVPRPKILIVEPNLASPIFLSASSSDGEIHVVTGDMPSIMAGLACGEPCRIGWETMRDHADFFFSVPDWVSAKGMRILGNPLDEDKKIISGESGAVSVGLIAEIMTNEKLKNIREMIGLNEESVVLAFSTEGDTDKTSYRRIVWDGDYYSFDK